MSPPLTQLFAFGIIATGVLVAAGPCDIYKSGNTPCAAAHSTTRALYNSYNGSLYQVSMGYGGATMDIKVLAPGGVANATAQDNFCGNSSNCLISMIYDQSGNGNHLSQAPGGTHPGPQPGGFDNLAPANAAPIMLNGRKVYGVFVAPGTGYRIDNTTGVAKNDDPEGIYAVLDGTHYDNNCCFDYGNAEIDDKDDGNATMEAIYFGTAAVPNAGNGPWIKADLENGLYSGKMKGGYSTNPSQTARFVHAIVKGDSGNHWAIRGGDATSGSLGTYYDGVRPPTYEKMKKQGAIVLGMGGDNTHAGKGTFYEGVLTTGFPSNSTEDSVHANIVAAKYST